MVATLTYTGNVAPVANPSTYSRPAGYPLIIPIAGNLATYWSDADGDPLALTGGISSTNGAAVSYDSSYVYYTNANDVADEIDYTIGDGQRDGPRRDQRRRRAAADQFRRRDGCQRQWQCHPELCRRSGLHISSGGDDESGSAGGLDDR